MSPPVRIVLDASACAAYCDPGRATAVGELIREVADEGAAFAVPTLSLAAALHVLDDGVEQAMRLRVLAAHSRMVELPAVEGWEALARAAAADGGLASGDARLAAARHGAYLVTAEPGRYAGADPDSIIGVD